MKADILSRKYQVSIKEDNKDVWLLKEELWTRKTTAEVTMLKKTTTMDKLEILEEIKRNNTREQEMVQALERDDELSWKQDGIVYMEERIYIPNNKKLKGEDFARKLQLSRCGTSRTAKDDGTTQTKLLVARSKERCQEICTRLLQNANRIKFSIRRNRENYIH